MTAAPTLAGVLEERRLEVEAALRRVLPPEGDDAKGLAAAMRYSTLAGGKRIRPVLCLLAAEACGRPESLPPREELAAAAAALELFHTYSLIHDDLPCMDDDALRRGKPTCHVVFGEATALLAGDTLQTLGFEVLATRPRGAGWGARRAEAVGMVAAAIGLDGMAGGQALDLAATEAKGLADPFGQLKRIHALKTGRLLRVSVELGALYGGADERLRAAAAAFGERLGLLFQIADDILDVTQESATLGKTAGKDAEQGKLTYPNLLGLDAAKAEMERVLASTLDAAKALDGRDGVLSALATYVARRDR
ncbi:MAG TPA: polyprenyl synthetase family protein [Thermoanaerobaculia bacterium]|nr:polyprenyl synthetase family protein [Thermoanaerobaculia bacterium]